MAVPDADTRWSVSDHTQLMDDASDADMDVPAVDDGTMQMVADILRVNSMT